MRKTAPKHWFSKKVLTWFKANGRHDLPWKKQLNPYRVWVSEIMLQQTQVATVIPYFEKFMHSFPNVTSLSKASLDEVLSHWAGLGYYARGRNLHKAANIIVQEYKGQFPKTVPLLQTLPGIGLSTAGAIVAQAFDTKATICDGNVKRVLARFHCVKGALGQKDVENTLWDLATHYTPNLNVGDYTQAIMDIGATICTRNKPQCERCPLQSRCEAYQAGSQSQFPERKKSKKIPQREVHVLCAIKNNSVLLQARPMQGIWGGLWSFPEFETLNALQAFANSNVTGLPALKHTFTHFHLLIKPYLTTNLRVKNKNLHWVSLDTLKTIGLPAPIKKLLRYDTISEKMRSV
ncbi:MAG: A/G-specific adenine glycosylase [Candidatus Berkiella sp.]